MRYRKIHSHLVEVSEVLSSDLATAIGALEPVPLPRRDDMPFPDYLCRAISGQQISVKAAASIWSRVVESAGQTPLTEHFAGCSDEVLRACGLSSAKTKTMQGIARSHLEAGLDKDTLGPLSPEDRAARLTQLWGVGQWTADMMNIFYFGEEDIWPEGDVAARKTLERLTSKRRKTLRTAERFKPYRSYLALYMWAHVDAPPDGQAAG